MRRRPGHTLIELMISTVVFATFLTVASDMIVRTLRSTASGESRGAALDQLNTFIYRISDELRQSDAILAPDRRTLMLQGSPFVVFHCPAGVVCYQLTTGQAIQRLLYEPGYPAVQSVVPGSLRNLTQTTSTLRFMLGGAGQPPPGQGGTPPGQVSNGPGTGLALALGTQQDTVTVDASVLMADGTPVSMRTKKTPWISYYPNQLAANR